MKRRCGLGSLYRKAPKLFRVPLTKKLVCSMTVKAMEGDSNARCANTFAIQNNPTGHDPPAAKDIEVALALPKRKANSPE